MFFMFGSMHNRIYLDWELLTMKLHTTTRIMKAVKGLKGE